MAYFERTYNSDWEVAHKYHQEEGLCYAHCTDWLWAATHIEEIDLSRCLTIRFNKRCSLPSKYKKPIFYLKWEDLKPEALSFLRSTQLKYASVNTDALAWGWIQEGKHFTVAPNFSIPTAYQSTGLSAYLMGYTYALVGWNYTNVSDPFGRTDKRNHQTALFRLAGNVHFFDPNIGHFVVPEGKFGNFFSDYFEDMVENENNNTKQKRSGEGGFFYNTMNVTGVKG